MGKLEEKPGGSCVVNVLGAILNPGLAFCLPGLAQ